MILTSIDIIILLSSAVFASVTYLVLKEARQSNQSLYINSNLGTLFFAAAILQWFLFGIAKNNTILILTCGFHFPLLFLTLKKFFKIKFKTDSKEKK
jgi:hypothetical protein